MTTTDLFAGSVWWVVYVRAVGQPVGCVYGGRAGTVRRWVDDHAEWAGPPEQLETFAFDSGPAAARGRLEIERRYAVA